MREQRKIALWTGAVCVVALAVATITDCKNELFISNIFIGIFSSSLLACSIAIISYFAERKKMLSLLYNGCLDFIESLNLNLSPECKLDIREAKTNLMSMKNVYLKEVFPYASQLTVILSQKSKLGKIISGIDKYARNLYIAIGDDINAIDRFYLGDITQEEIKHYDWKYVTPNSLNSLKLLCESLDKLANNQLKSSVEEAKSDAD